jgi:hypothetical protein
MCKFLSNLFSGWNPYPPTSPPVPTPEPIPEPITPEPISEPIPAPIIPTKKAVLVGINKYPAHMDADLSGCVNDVINMRNLLVEKYGFDPDNIRVLTDDRATKASIFARLEWLMDSNKGDELVFHYSGHGSQVRDRNGDELNDDLDEILIPYDHDWDTPLLDDEIGEIFKKQPVGTNLTMLADCCHSGSISRAISKKKKKNRFLTPPFDIRNRSLDRDLSLRKIGVKPKGTQRHILASGCKDNQTSADAYIGATWQGAFTYALTSTLKTNPNQSWTSAIEKLSSLLEVKGYDQTPQLSGDDKDKLVFGGAV